MKTQIEKATKRPWQTSGTFEQFRYIDSADGTSNICQCFGSILADSDDASHPINQVRDSNAALIVQAVNEYEALCAVAEAVTNMRHDINIFYAKYRESGNSYKLTLDSAIATLNAIRGKE